MARRFLRAGGILFPRLFLAACWLAAFDGCAPPTRAGDLAPNAQGSVAAVSEPKFGLQVYQAHPGGVRSRQFSRQWGLWGPWVEHGNQSGVNPATAWDPYLVGVGWADSLVLPFQSRVNLFHAFVTPGSDPGVRLGEVFRGVSLGGSVGYPYNYNAHVTPAPFFPKTVTAHNPGYVNLWGTEGPGHQAVVPGEEGTSATRLLERFWNGSTWIFQDHGVPRAGFALLVGPTAAASRAEGDGNLTAVVAVAQYFSNGYGYKPELAVRRWFADRGRWGWVYLPPLPDARISHARAPLAVVYRRDNQTRVRVFVACHLENGPYERFWELYSTEMHPDGVWRNEAGQNWQWNRHGEAPGLPRLQQFDRPADGFFAWGFHLTHAANWRDGATERVNLFGHSDAGDRLIEFFYDGAAWRWGTTDHRHPAGSLKIRCAGVAFTARPATPGVANPFRLGIYAEIEDGSATGSQVWERFFDTVEGGGWRWLRLR
jgi:hypothetical protein